MPKFHDEFFRSGSSKHDELVSKIINEKERIMGELWLQRSWYNKFVSDDKEIYLCTQDKPEWCVLESETANRDDIAECVVVDYRYSDDEPERFRGRCKYCDIEVIKQKTIGIKDHWYAPSFKVKRKLVVCETFFEDKYHPNDIEYETEKICTSRPSTFIIGYIDILFKIRLQRTFNAKIRNGWIWNNYASNYKELKIVVDAKPELKDWGGPLRQIKTYMMSEGADYGVIVTYSKVSDAHQEILAKENVFVITLETQSDNKKVDLTSFGD